MNEKTYIKDLQRLHDQSCRYSDTLRLSDELLAYVVARLVALKRTINAPDKEYMEVSLKAIEAFRDAVPLHVLQSPGKKAFLLGTETISIWDANRAFIETLRNLPFTEIQKYPPYYHDFSEPEPRFDRDEPLEPARKVEWRNERRRFEDTELNGWKERKRQYEKLQKQHARELTPQEQLTIGTPLFPQAAFFGTHIGMQVPFKIHHENRVAHQFVLGPSRSGKTTFLKAQIMSDILAVQRGECSLIVMDSHNELIPSLARLSIGAEVLYLEPSKYPISMNIFDQGDVSHIPEEDRGDHYRAAYETIFFFLNSIARTDTTGHQETILKFAIQAVSTIPNATVETLRQLLEPGGLANLKLRFVNLHPTVLDWLEKAFDQKKSDYGPSIVAVRNRLAGLVADPLFRDMFSHQNNKLDLFDLLRSPKVILINTAGLGDATGPFGRFVIAKLEEATSKRRFVTFAEKLPVYAYIDEASDYISEEPKVARMIDKLGKQNLGMIFATQREAHIHDFNVLDALKNTSIQCVTKKPNVHISIDGAEAAEVEVVPVDLRSFPQRTDEQFAKLRSNMKDRFAPDPIEQSKDYAPSAAPNAEEPDPDPSKTSNVRPDAQDWK